LASKICRKIDIFLLKLFQVTICASFFNTIGIPVINLDTNEFDCSVEKTDRNWGNINYSALLSLSAQAPKE
jgi:hypothetical protein